MLTTHHSNRLEALVDALASVTGAPLGSPFASEVIVVQSRGVARWLSLKLADRAGVCANVRFPFPNAYAWELFRAMCGDIPEQSAFDPDVLAWRILDVLAEAEALALYAPVQAYTGGDPLRRFELAARLAALYDEYLVYRPDWVAAWERGKPVHWQADLWRRLSIEAAVPYSSALQHLSSEAAPHRAALHAHLVERLGARKTKPFSLPERVSIFGAPALPPTLIELFTALARHTDVHLFVQNPCREYWGDIASTADIARRTLAGRADARYLESGNRLLASLGKQGRDFFDLIAGVENDTAQHADAFVEPSGASLLESLQAEILELRERTPEGPRSVIGDDDCSLQVHSCHSAMREVEVLHDQLLALFSRWPDVEPSDVVVMTPDIESYAPYIEAVFATATPRISFNVSDRSAEHSSTLAATFMALLELRGSRFEAHRVLAPMDEASVRRRFGLSEGDLETVRRWVGEAQIRWGIDAEHRAGFGVPATHEHTWRFGLTRLMLGYALPGGGEKLFEGVLPYDEIEGSLGEVLGRFSSYAHAAIALDTQLAGSKPVRQWCDILHGVIDSFFDPAEERAEELESARAAIASIEQEARAARYAGAVPLAVMTAVLRARLEVPGRAFLSGGVTFCAMVPMRSLPFDIVCMIGMNDRAYPRVRRRDGFDLMADDFRKGDRARRDDDRYLFLETLLNARHCLYISYTGRHIREDTAMPPAVLVAELLEYVEHGHAAANGCDVRSRLVTEHPLQAFSPRYFVKDAKLFSYSEAVASAASAAGRGKQASQRFITGELPPPDMNERVVDLDTLVRFFRNPARHLLEGRLKVRLETADEELHSREPFELDGLALFKLKERLLDLRLRGEPHEGVALARASGVLPHGRMGDVLFETQSVIVDQVAAQATRFMPDALLDPLAFELASKQLTLTGTLTRMSADGMLVYRVAKAGAHVRVNAWIRHLALNAFAPRGAGRVSRCISQDCVLTYAPVENARERLLELLDLYWTGLHRPLRFFPRTACEYAKHGEIGYKVRQVWEGAYPDYRGGERNNAYFALAFRGVDPLDDEFERTALTVFGQMAGSLKEEALT